MSFHKGDMKAVVRASGGPKLEGQSKRKVWPTGSPLRLVCLFITGARNVRRRLVSKVNLNQSSQETVTEPVKQQGTGCCVVNKVMREQG